MALTRLNNRSLAANAAISSDKIADGAITTSKIAAGAVTHSKTNIVGSMLYTVDASIASNTANGWMTMSDTVTLPSSGSLESWGNMLSITYFGYISSGTYYYTWRVYDITAGQVVLPVRSNEYRWYGNSNGSGGGFAFSGSVHSASNQAARCLDITGRAGNQLRLEMSASSGGGDAVYTNGAQTLYADNIFWYGGYMSGMHGENGY